MSREYLEEMASKLAENVRGFESRTLERIGKRIKQTGQISMYDQKALENMANIGVDLNEIYKDLAKTTSTNIEEMQKMFESEMEEQVLQSQELYKAKGVKYVPFSQNKMAQQMVKAWEISTAGQMINLSKTKAVGFAVNGKYQSVDKAYHQAVDKAIVAVRSGTQDFNTAMKDTINELGGSGLVYYDSKNKVARQLDVAVRQNVLYGVKQSCQDYQDYIGEELGCDGFSVDYHPNARPSHVFMGGKVFSYENEVTINGVTYPNGSEALERLQEYGCLHFKKNLILGISKPEYDEEWLEKQKQQDEQLIEYNGKSKTGYEWQQHQRALERQIRAENRMKDFAKSEGNMSEYSTHLQKAKTYKKSYKKFCERTGLQPTKERFNFGGTAVKNPKSQERKGKTAFSQKQLDKMNEKELRKLAKDIATEYYKLGKSRISFGGANVEEIAEKMVKQGTKTSLKKDILAMQKKLKT